MRFLTQADIASFLTEKPVAAIHFDANGIRSIEPSRASQWQMLNRCWRSVWTLGKCLMIP